MPPRFLLIILTICITDIVVAVGLPFELKFADKRFSYILTLDSTLTGDDVNYDCVIKSISIRQLTDNRLMQTIIPKENYPSCGLPKNQLFQLEDVNFDGYNDFLVLQFLPAAPNLPYYYWTFNPKTNQFHQDTTLEEITSPTFHPETRTITSFWRNGCCTHGNDTYMHVNGQIKLIEQIEISSDQETDKQTTIKRKLINGQLQEYSRTTD